MTESATAQAAALYAAVGFVAGAATVFAYTRLGQTRVAASEPKGAASASSAPKEENTVRPLSLADLERDCKTVPDTHELKQVLLVRSDLGMGKGKVAAQCSHAAVGCYQLCQGNQQWRDWCQAWNFRGCAKITLKVDSEAAMDEIAAAATEAGLPNIIIEDAGRTEIPEGTRTVLGIGPAPKNLIDALTGPKGKFPLKLLT